MLWCIVQGCGTTLLHVASSLGNLAVVNVLLRHGADVDASEVVTCPASLFNRQELHCCACFCYELAVGWHIPVALMQLTGCLHSLCVLGQASGATPLYEAAVVGHVEVVTALLQAGAVAAVSCHTEAWGHQWTPPQLERTVGIRNWHQRRLARCPDAVPAPVWCRTLMSSRAAWMFKRSRCFTCAMSVVAPLCDCVTAGCAALQDFGETPLRAAARLGHVAVLHALVAAGDSVSTEQVGFERGTLNCCW